MAPIELPVEIAGNSIASLESENAALKEKIAELTELAYRDYLTTVANRRSFDKALNTEWRRAIRGVATPIALVFIDLDHFKEVVDTLGHDTSNWLLRDVGKALSNIKIRGFDLIARYGGDEFVFLLVGCDTTGAARVAKLALDAIRAVAVPETCRAMTASVGIASMVPSANAQPKALIDAADKAMYAAKTGGRNQIASAR